VIFGILAIYRKDNIEKTKIWNTSGRKAVHKNVIELILLLRIYQQEENGH